MHTELQKQALEYMAVAQPLIERLTTSQSNYQTKAADVAPVFVSSGLIADVDSKKFTEKLASDPSVALQYLVKLAGMLQSHSDLGAPVETTSDKLDSFERWALFGDPNANPRASSATV